MAVALVIFDLGNTLVDYHGGGFSDEEKDLIGLHRMHMVLRKRFPQLTLTALYDEFYRPWLKAQTHRSKKVREYDVRHFLGKAIDLADLTEPQYRRAMLAFHGPFIETVRGAPGALELLRDLSAKGIYLALLANSPIPGFCHDAALARIGLLSFLKTRVFSYDIGMRKPDTRLFQMLMSQADAQPSSTVMVGDSERLDLVPARSLGIHAIKFDCRIEGQSAASGNQSKWLSASTLSDLRQLLAQGEEDASHLSPEP